MFHIVPPKILAQALDTSCAFPSPENTCNITTLSNGYFQKIAHMWNGRQLAKYFTTSFWFATISIVGTHIKMMISWLPGSRCPVQIHAGSRIVILMLLSGWL